MVVLLFFDGEKNMLKTWFLSPVGAKFLARFEALCCSVALQRAYICEFACQQELHTKIDRVLQLIIFDQAHKMGDQKASR